MEKISMQKKNKMIWNEIFKIEASLRKKNFLNPKSAESTEKSFSLVQTNSEAIEDYRDLKENMVNTEFSLSKPQVAYKYAEVRVKPGK